MNVSQKGLEELGGDLPEGDVRALGVHPLGSLAEGMEWIGERVSGDFSYAVVPYANAVSATVDHRASAERSDRFLRQSTDVA